MSRLVVGLLVISACGDGQPCYDDDEKLCVGDIFVDMSTRNPTFEIDGLGEVSPTRLSVVLVDDGAEDDLCTGWSGMTSWEVSRLDEGAMPITYGELPEGAREEAPARNLQRGRTYTATFGVDHAGLLADSWTSNTQWDAVFVAGDDASAMTMAERCP